MKARSLRLPGYKAGARAQDPSGALRPWFPGHFRVEADAVLEFQVD